ncbi:hypothetical protein HDE_14362 [Halotydeus destructor]|nr:hypothetical protein HDE_14362 [Halotydeus destructor]
MFINKVMSKSKFRGCLIGSLIGDCLGAPFEGDSKVGVTFLTNYMNNLLAKDRVNQIYPYTDDTAMTKSLCESLISCKKLRADDLAMKFTDEFFRAPLRGYGRTVKETFLELHETKFSDPFEPAKKQFNGQGSLGNGAAMRVAPVALLSVSGSIDDAIELARIQALITHTHPLGYNGSILQCLAVRQALEIESQPEQFDAIDFLERLIGLMKPIEDGSPKVRPSRAGDRIKRNRVQPDSQTPYTDLLTAMKDIMSSHTPEIDLSTQEVVSRFGNSVSALQSVPTAIYCFLRAHKQLKDFSSDDILMRTLFGAICIGGDTDTIATMACALVGAAYGDEAINETLTKQCESWQLVCDYADKLSSIVKEKESQ